jgi:uncharacterized protein (TIGR00255 family)
MLKSMTGYGSSEANDDLCFQAWEITSVNARQMNLKWRLPHFLRSQEPALEQEVRQFASRGRVEISLNLQLARSETIPMSLNRPAAWAMLDQLRTMAADRGEGFEPDFNRLLNIPWLWQESGAEQEQELVSRLLEGLREALRDWDDSRLQEGQALQEDLLGRIGLLRDALHRLRHRSEGLAEEKFALLQERVHALLEQAGAEQDRDRMLQELAVLSDKLDISEELTRLRTHLDTLEDSLQSGEAGGRKLDFLLQECFREINTCGNKAQDTTVSHLAVEFKTELEKCREQVQNLE